MKTILSFNNGSIKESDWNIMYNHIKENNVETVLEIGAGYSTILFDKTGVALVSYESDLNWINKIKPNVSSNTKIVNYSYPYFPKCELYFDMAFVDGPGRNNNNGRADSMIFSRNLTDVIFIHDSSRTNEKKSITNVFPDSKWEKKYNSGGLSMVTRRNTITKLS